MWTAIIGFLVVVTIVFAFGLLSARRSAELRHRKSKRTVVNTSYRTTVIRSPADEVRGLGENGNEDRGQGLAMAAHGTGNVAYYGAASQASGR